MNLDAIRDRDCDVLIESVGPRYARIFRKAEYSSEERRAIYKYLFSQRPRKLPPSMKNRLINLYDPLADRSSRFPDGLRWCLNVYVGCWHNCGYCYVNGYSQKSVGVSPHAKGKFERKLLEDLRTLAKLGVPPAPLHMSNSTDPLQQTLEEQNRHALLSLQQIAEHRAQFTSVVMLTKNPGILCTEPYFSVIGDPAMRPITVQITCPYWRDDVRLFFESRAPSVGDRLDALRFLAENGVAVELRIDPLFPSSRIDDNIRLHRPLHCYSIPEPQSHEDILNLVRLAKESNVKAIVAKPLKVPVSRRAQHCKDWFADIYEDANEAKTRSVRGGSWRLPDVYQKALVSTLSELCIREDVQFRHCMHDVLTRM